jgi:hypothetical protein
MAAPSRGGTPNSPVARMRTRMAPQSDSVKESDVMEEHKEKKKRKASPTAMMTSSLDAPLIRGFTVLPASCPVSWFGGPKLYCLLFDTDGKSMEEVGRVSFLLKETACMEKYMKAIAKYLKIDMDELTFYESSMPNIIKHVSEEELKASVFHFFYNELRPSSTPNDMGWEGMTHYIGVKVGKKKSNEQEDNDDEVDEQDLDDNGYELDSYPEDVGFPLDQREKKQKISHPPSAAAAAAISEK